MATNRALHVTRSNHFKILFYEPHTFTELFTKLTISFFTARGSHQCSQDHSSSVAIITYLATTADNVSQVFLYFLYCPFEINSTINNNNNNRNQITKRREKSAIECHSDRATCLSCIASCSRGELRAIEMGVLFVWTPWIL